MADPSWEAQVLRAPSSELAVLSLLDAMHYDEAVFRSVSRNTQLLDTLVGAALCGALPLRATTDGLERGAEAGGRARQDQGESGRERKKVSI